LRSSEKTEKLEKTLKNERFLLFMCFLTGALIGYILTHHVVLFGA
jgi:hypothetical protein